mmetsp:Transcript_7506/g.16014  ORF Transcript_7506/g.16014 Transcript_7506/m.16014 type:complete len:80 (+) Transcript_7506:248-487(+)
MVLSLWATTISVQDWSSKILFKIFWTSSSFLPSSAAVASSRIRILGLHLLRPRARAIAKRCRCPPLKLAPFSPSEPSRG